MQGVQCTEIFNFFPNISEERVSSHKEFIYYFVIILFPNFNDPRDELPLSSWRKPVFLSSPANGSEREQFLPSLRGK